MSAVCRQIYPTLTRMHAKPSEHRYVFGTNIIRESDTIYYPTYLLSIFKLKGIAHHQAEGSRQ